MIGIPNTAVNGGSLHDHREVQGRPLGRESRPSAETIGLVKKEPVEKVSRSSG